MTKAEMEKGIEDLKRYTLHSKERIAKAEAKIAEMKKDLNEAIDSERLIKALEHEIEVEKTSIEDNDRMIAEFTAELNKIEASGDNVEAADYVVTLEAQEVAVQADDGGVLVNCLAYVDFEVEGSENTLFDGENNGKDTKAGKMWVKDPKEDAAMRYAGRFTGAG